MATVSHVKGDLITGFTGNEGLGGGIQSPFEFPRLSSLLKNALVAFFNLAKCGAKLRTEAQNNDLRRYFVIASMRCRSLLIKSTGC